MTRGSEMAAAKSSDAKSAFHSRAASPYAIECVEDFVALVAPAVSALPASSVLLASAALHAKE